MPTDLIWWVALIILPLVAIAATVFIMRQSARQTATAAGQHLASVERKAADRVRQAQEEAQRVLEEARTKQKEIVLQAHEERLRMRAELESEFREHRAQLQS